MQELREHAQERFGEAMSASRSQLLTEANEELQRRSTQANELLEAERRRNRELQQRLEQAQSSVGRLEKKMDEQALALQRVGDENAEAILREDRLVIMLMMPRITLDRLVHLVRQTTMTVPTLMVERRKSPRRTRKRKRKRYRKEDDLQRRKDVKGRRRAHHRHPLHHRLLPVLSSGKSLTSISRREMRHPKGMK